MENTQTVKTAQQTAHALKKYVGISRRKVARIGVECKGLSVADAKAKLSFLPQHAARDLKKTIRSAEGNFLFKNPNFNTDLLLVENIIVEKGPTLKRMRPRARGSADRINKKTCHIKVVVAAK